MSKRRTSVFKKIVIAIVGGFVLLIVLGVIGYFNDKPKSESKPESLTKCFQISGPTQRTTADQPDDNTQDYQVHIMYVLPSDGTDRQLDTNGTIATSVSAFENWLCNQAKGSTVKLDTYKGALDVTFVRLDVTDQTIANGADLKVNTGNNPKEYIVLDLRTHLKALGFKDPHKLYAIYYDGSADIDACGEGFATLHTAVAFLHGHSQGRLDWDCDRNTFTTDLTKPGFWDLVTLHEIVHALGFVPSCAPHVYQGSHVADSKYDLMYGQDDTINGNDWDVAEPQKIVLDYNRNDYYDANIPNCPDLKDSIFLTGGGKQVPLEWNKL